MIFHSRLIGGLLAIDLLAINLFNAAGSCAADKGWEKEKERGCQSVRSLTPDLTPNPTLQ